MKTHTLELTYEQIEKYGLRELVPFTGWTKKKEGYDTWLGYFENNILKYGISIDGKWFQDLSALPFDSAFERPATDDEAEKGLIGMAEKLGFKKGVTFIDTDGDKQVATENPKHSCKRYYKIGSALYCGKGTGFIFLNGVWAEIIEEPLTLEQRIEKIEKHLGL